MSFAAHFYTAALGGKRREREPGGNECQGWGGAPRCAARRVGTGGCSRFSSLSSSFEGASPALGEPPARPSPVICCGPVPCSTAGVEIQHPLSLGSAGGCEHLSIPTPPPDSHRFCPRAQPLPAPSPPHPPPSPLSLPWAAAGVRVAAASPGGRHGGVPLCPPPPRKKKLFGVCL